MNRNSNVFNYFGEKEINISISEQFRLMIQYLLVAQL